MSKYIDADKLIAEFQKRFDICKRISEDDRNALDTMDWYRGKYTAYSECLYFIASLQQEQPEVELEKELAAYIQHWDDDEEFGLVMSTEQGIFQIQLEDIRDIARHFFELGCRNKKV